MIPGFSPDVAVLLGHGYSREDFKSLDGGRDAPVVTAGKSVFTLRSLAEEIVKGAEPLSPRPASPLLRQEYVRLIFSHPQASQGFPALQRLQGQPGFLRKVSDAMAESRLTAAHAEEREVQLERLASLGMLPDEDGNGKVRAEVLMLSELWRGWLQVVGRLDECGMLEKASQILSAGGPWFGSHLRRIELHSHAPLQSLEGRFIEELSHRIPVETVQPRTPESGDPGGRFERWHTVEDAAEALADQLCARIESGVPHSELVVLIPDGGPAGAAVRRALARVLSERNIPELDARDPLEVRLSEEIRHAFLAASLAAGGFEHIQLLEWLRVEAGLSEALLVRAHEVLCEAGARHGWRSLNGAPGELLPAGVRRRLERLEAAARHPLGLSELSEVFAVEPGSRVSARIRAWVESLLTGLREDLEALGLADSRHRLAEWLDRLRLRAEQSPAPVRRVRPRTGIRVVRMGQFNAGFQGLEVFVLGASSRWLSEARAGDLYLGAREREILGSEFAVASVHSARTGKVMAFSSWMAAAAPESLHVLDYQFEMDGSERERIEPLLGELGVTRECTESGAHPRQVPGYSIVSEVRQREVRLDPVPPSASGSVELTATDLEAYSRCPFTALIRSRWKLRSPDDPDLSLWSSTNGQLLHAAVESLVRAIEAEPAQVRLDPEQASRRAVEVAWSLLESRGGPKGWVPSPQLRIQIERNAVKLLCLFLEKEWAYRARAGVRLLAAEEDAKLEWGFVHEGRSYRVRGKADRIDEHPDGLWVIDYKSGGQSHKGGDMRQRGYRLQLAFYAIAAQARFEKPVLGAQLVEVTRAAKRGVGFFPKKWNGRREGCLTEAGSTNSSLFDFSPSDLWNAMEERIRSAVVSRAAGVHDARPVIGDSECRECRLRSACGQARREWVEET